MDAAPNRPISTHTPNVAYFNLEKAVGNKVGESIRDSLANLALAIHGAANILELNGEKEHACALLRIFWAFGGVIDPLLHGKVELVGPRGRNEI